MKYLIAQDSRLGARKIYAFASHALLSGPAVERLRASPIDEVAVPAGTVGYELMCALAPRVPVVEAS